MLAPKVASRRGTTHYALLNMNQSWHLPSRWRSALYCKTHHIFARIRIVLLAVCKLLRCIFGIEEAMIRAFVKGALPEVP